MQYHKFIFFTTEVTEFHRVKTLFLFSFFTPCYSVVIFFMFSAALSLDEKPFRGCL